MLVGVEINWFPQILSRYKVFKKLNKQYQFTDRKKVIQICTQTLFFSTVTLYLSHNNSAAEERMKFQEKQNQSCP